MLAARRTSGLPGVLDENYDSGEWSIEHCHEMASCTRSSMWTCC